jgi:transposase
MIPESVLYDCVGLHRFARAEELTCWAGLTPKHHESDTRFTAAISPSRGPG